MNRLDFVLKSRGLQNSIDRTISIGRRFSFRDTPMIRRLECFSGLMEEFGTKPSFSISTVLLERYPSLGQYLKRSKAEFLSHGHTHVDFTKLSASEHCRLIAMSRVLLHASGQDPTGFRAPYLHWNDDLLKAAADAGFEFDSSSVAWWSLSPQINLSADQADAYRRAQQFYEPYLCRQGTRGLPFFRKEGILEIPVSLPDDEMLIDRLHITRPDVLAQVWRQMLDHTYAVGGLLNLQLHPERFYLVAEALRNVLNAGRSKNPRVWITSLTEIHRWWKRKPEGSRWPDGYQSALCVAGDIDCATLQDFIWRFVERG